MAKSPKTPAKAVSVPVPLEPVKVYDFDKLLTAEQREEITAKAKARVEAEEREGAEHAYLMQMMDEEQKRLHPEIVQEIKEIRIELPLYADRIVLDGKQFFHGLLYKVPKGQCDVMLEIMAKSKRHDEEVHGANADGYYRQQRQYQMSMRTGAATGDGVPVRF